MSGCETTHADRQRAPTPRTRAWDFAHRVVGKSPSPTRSGVTTPHAGDSRSTEASGIRMNRRRTPPAALPALTGAAVAASQWRWSTVELEPSGRLLLPSAARRCLAADSSEARSVSGVVRGDTLVLRPGAGNGRSRLCCVDR